VTGKIIVTYTVTGQTTRSMAGGTTYQWTGY
jgi:hypothetical protein